jgi:hypothetical protein
VTLFVFFAAATGAGMVTADFLYRQYALFFFGRQDTHYFAGEVPGF